MNIFEYAAMIHFKLCYTYSTNVYSFPEMLYPIRCKPTCIDNVFAHHYVKRDYYQQENARVQTFASFTGFAFNKVIF